MPPQRSAKLFLATLLVVYLIILHVGIAAVVLSPNLRASIAWRLPGAAKERQEAFWQGMVAAQARLDGTLPPGGMYFIGDSGVQSLDVAQVADRAVNYGIGGDTISGVLRRLEYYKSLASARGIVILIGSNDLVERPASEAVAAYAKLLAALPGVPLVLVAVLPIDERAVRYGQGHRSNTEIGRFNAAIKAGCAARPSCSLVDLGAAVADATGNLAPAFDEGDGLHLNPSGYRVLIEALRAEVARRVAQ